MNSCFHNTLSLKMVIKLLNYIISLQPSSYQPKRHPSHIAWVSSKSLPFILSKHLEHILLQRFIIRIRNSHLFSGIFQSLHLLKFLFCILKSPTWVYTLSVTAISECPIKYCNVLGFMPDFAILEQYVCLQTCGVILGIHCIDTPILSFSHKSSCFNPYATCLYLV